MEKSFKIPLSSQGNPKESTSWLSTEAAMILHSLIIPHPPTRKGIFINSTQIQRVENTVPVLTDKPQEQGRRERKFASFSLFPVWKSCFFLHPRVITWEKEAGDTKVSLKQEEKGPEKLTFHFWGLFPVFFKLLFPQRIQGKAVAQLISLTASWHENNLFSFLICTKNTSGSSVESFAVCPPRNLAVFWVDCENKGEFPFTLRRTSWDFSASSMKEFYISYTNKYKKGPYCYICSALYI